MLAERGRESKGRQGTGREGKGREGKGREGKVLEIQAYWQGMIRLGLMGQMIYD